MHDRAIDVGQLHRLSTGRAYAKLSRRCAHGDPIRIRVAKVNSVFFRSQALEIFSPKRGMYNTSLTAYRPPRLPEGVPQHPAEPNNRRSKGREYEAFVYGSAHHDGASDCPGFAGRSGGGRIADGHRRTRGSPRSSWPARYGGGCSWKFLDYVQVLRPAADGRPATRILRRSQQVRCRCCDGLGCIRSFHRGLGGVAPRQSGPYLRRCVVKLRTHPACPHDLCHFWLWRQCIDRYVLLRDAADVAGAAAGSVEPLVRAARLQPVLPAGCDRLHAGYHAVSRIRRAGVVCRHLAGGRLDRVFRDLFTHAGAP